MRTIGLIAIAFWVFAPGAPNAWSATKSDPFWKNHYEKNFKEIDAKTQEIQNEIKRLTGLKTEPGRDPSEFPRIDEMIKNQRDELEKKRSELSSLAQEIASQTGLSPKDRFDLLTRAITNPKLWLTSDQLSNLEKKVKTNPKILVDGFPQNKMLNLIHFEAATPLQLAASCRAKNRSLASPVFGTANKLFGSDLMDIIDVSNEQGIRVKYNLMDDGSVQAALNECSSILTVKPDDDTPTFSDGISKIVKAKQSN